MDTLLTTVEMLAVRLPDLQRQRSVTPFANDVYEAADYWHRLGVDILENNTRTNFPEIVPSELRLLAQLEAILATRSAEEQTRYAQVFQAGRNILGFAEKVQLSEDGHLGILRVIRQQFGFLEMDYGFRVTHQKPTGLRFSSDTVYVDLAWAKKYASSSCSFGAETNAKQSFWIEDLLFMYGDQRYRTLPEDLGLDTEDDVERWFTFLASIFKQYGHDVLSNQPGIFDKLAKAQAERDREYTQEMDRLYGQKSNG
jgi:hypothetical protein